MDNKKEHPLILVFYIDREMIMNKEVMGSFVNSVDMVIKQKNDNIRAFFMPTDKEERLECINPILATDEQNKKIDKLIKELETQFDVKKRKLEDEDAE